MIPRGSKLDLRGRVIQRVFHLDPPSAGQLIVERDLRVPMRDGVILLADRWVPAEGGDSMPTALLRLPYGRSGLMGDIMARPLAERGFQVLIQSVRGTFGSGGDFDPIRREREDGLDTLDWLVAQDWSGDAIILYGASYLGYVQWAVADAVPPQVKAMIPITTDSALMLDFLREDAFSLETPYLWGLQVAGQERRFSLPRQLLGQRRARRALHTLPLEQAEQALLGRRDDFLQNILTHNAASPFWQEADHRDRVADVRVPVSSVAGWFDIFLPGQLRDYKVLQDSGVAPLRLTVGPWAHGALGSGTESVVQAIDFGLALAQGREPEERAPVRLFVMGVDQWRDFSSWPPPDYEPISFHLQADGGLSQDAPTDAPPDRYRYDPSNPTPALGGVRNVNAGKAGRVDNAALEARADVLTFTTAVLDDDIEVIGEVTARIWFRSNLPHADVFVRLCDVDPGGRSVNVCDGLVSLTGADEITLAEVTLWPTAYTFRRGHAIRVQVSSGAFPRYNRNPGSGEPRGQAVALRAADQEVFHEPKHPSAIVLPIRSQG